MADPNFDPNNPDAYFQDFNQFAPNYTLDQGQSDMQLQELQDAMAYVQAHPELGNQAYLLSELNADIGAQQAVGGLIGGQAGVKSATDAIGKYTNPAEGIIGVKGSGSFTTTKGAADWFQDVFKPQWIQEHQQEYNDLLKMGKSPEQMDFLIVTKASPGGGFVDLARKQYDPYVQNLQTGLGTAQTALNPLQAKALETFRLPTPDYGTAQEKVKQYYYDPQQGQIANATKAGNQDIYQMAYNLRKGVNEKAAQLGATSSGSRQKALGKVSGEAFRETEQLKESAETEAQKAMKEYQDSIAKQQREQLATEGQIKSGTAESLFGAGTQDLMSAYKQNTQAQSQAALSAAEREIAQKQADDSMWSDIFGGIGTAVGTIGGTIVGGPLGGMAAGTALGALGRSV